jgi:hypothetical protein
MTTAMAETVVVTATATAMMPPLPPIATMSMMTMAVIQGRRLDSGDLTTRMGQQLCTSTMTAMKVMAEMATAMVMVMAMATAAAMMTLPPPTATMSMKTMAAIQGGQLDDGNWTTTMGQQ